MCIYTNFIYIYSQVYVIISSPPTLCVNWPKEKIKRENKLVERGFVSLLNVAFWRKIHWEC